MQHHNEFSGRLIFLATLTVALRFEAIRPNEAPDWSAVYGCAPDFWSTKYHYLL